MSRHPAATAAALLILASSLVAAGCSKSDNKATNPPAAKELDSGDILAGANYVHRFAAPGTFPYHCEHHSMNGTVNVSNTLPATDSSVSIVNNSFGPNSVTIPVGNKVTWTNNSGGTLHTVTSDP